MAERAFGRSFFLRFTEFDMIIFTGSTVADVRFASLIERLARGLHVTWLARDCDLGVLSIIAALQDSLRKNGLYGVHASS